MSAKLVLRSSTSPFQRWSTTGGSHDAKREAGTQRIPSSAPPMTSCRATLLSALLLAASALVSADGIERPSPLRRFHGRHGGEMHEETSPHARVGQRAGPAGTPGMVTEKRAPGGGRPAIPGMASSARASET